jgi:hypothetical protein
MGQVFECGWSLTLIIHKKIFKVKSFLVLRWQLLSDLKSNSTVRISLMMIMMIPNTEERQSEI